MSKTTLVIPTTTLTSLFVCLFFVVCFLFLFFAGRGREIEGIVMLLPFVNGKKKGLTLYFPVDFITICAQPIFRNLQTM